MDLGWWLDYVNEDEDGRREKTPVSTRYRMSKRSG